MTLTPSFRFQKVTGVLSAQYALSRGASPSICTITITPDVPLSRAPADMFWSDGFRSVRFRDCLINDVSPGVDTDGKETVTVSILDRRWRFGFEQISGQYNIRSGNRVLDQTAKNPKDLAKLCLDALGEKDYDVSQMPEDVFPYTNWDLTSIDSALEELCRAVGTHVVLDENDRIRIVKDGVGKDLPRLSSINKSVAYDFGIVPGQAVTTAAPVQYQFDFDLCPIGKEKTAELRPLDALSYKPAIGWAFCEPFQFMNIPDPDDRHLAIETVWRWYQVCPPGWMIRKNDMTYEVSPSGQNALRKLPIDGLAIQNMWQFLPLLEHQLDVERMTAVDAADSGNRTRTGIGGIVQSGFDRTQWKRRSPWVWGVFDDGSGSSQENIPVDLWGEPIEKDVKNLKMVYTKSFDIDYSLGIVKFAEPVYRYVRGDKKPLDRYEIPILHLRIAANFHSGSTRAPWRRTYSVPIAGGIDAKTKVFEAHEDVVPEVVRYSQETCPDKRADRDNFGECETRLKWYASKIQKKFELKTPSESTHPLLIPYSPDGQIAQVVFAIDGSGKMTTSVYRQKESLLNIVSYEERRDLDRVYETMKQIQASRSGQGKNAR